MSRRMFRKQVLARYWNAPRVRSKSLFTGTLRSVYASCFPPTLLSFSERKATVWIGHDRFIIFLHFRRSSLIIRSSVLLLFVSLYGSFRWSLFPSLMLGTSLSYDISLWWRERKIENFLIRSFTFFWWKCLKRYFFMTNKISVGKINLQWIYFIYIFVRGFHL